MMPGPSKIAAMIILAVGNPRANQAAWQVWGKVKALSQQGDLLCCAVRLGIVRIATKLLEGRS